ncbi:MAG: hypothetical protein RL551_1270 [Pseudomonadota bacterium]
MFCECHGGLEWQGRLRAHSEYRQKIGGKYGVEACHIVCPENSKNDRYKQNWLSEKSAKKYLKQGFWSFRGKCVSTL